MKKEWMALLAVIIASFCFTSCIAEEEEEEDKSQPLSLQEVARNIDYQMGEIALQEGEPRCDDISTGVDFGTHCKNLLRGRINTNKVRDIVRIMSDDVLFGNVKTGTTVMAGVTVRTGIFLDDTPFYLRGFPVAENPCTLDSNDNDRFDYAEFASEFCNQNGVNFCQEKGDHHYVLNYVDCHWPDPLAGATWELDGAVDIQAYVSQESEQVIVKSYSGFTGGRLEQGVSTGTYQVWGTATRYLVLDPFDGQPATGTTPGGATDGMWMVNISAVVDSDGAGASPLSGRYPIYYSVDDEDGLILLSGYDAAWPSSFEPEPFNEFNITNIYMFDADRPWNGLGPYNGDCKVSISVDPFNRTFNMSSKNGSGNDCLPPRNNLDF